MVPRALPGVIPKSRIRSKFFVLPGVCPPKKIAINRARDCIEFKVLALHMDGPGKIPGTVYGSLSTTRRVP